jgi:hypothetical protein
LLDPPESADGRHAAAGQLILLLLVCSVGFLGARLILIFCPGQDGWSPQMDEMATGNAALVVERGLDLPLPLCQYKAHMAATTFEGLLSLPFRRYFGPSLLALKLAAVIWNLLSLIVWTALAWRFFGRLAGSIVGFLFAFPPPFFGLMTITAWATHAESLLFTGVCLYLLFQTVKARRWPTQTLSAGLSGLAGGLGGYLCYAGFLTLGFALLMLVATTPSPARKRLLLAFTAGAVVGLLPFLWSLEYYPLTNLFVVSAGRSPAPLTPTSSFARALGKLYRFWRADVWQSALFSRSYYARSVLSLVFGAAVAFAWAVALLRRREIFTRSSRREGADAHENALAIVQLSGFFFPLLFSLVYAVSPFRVEPVSFNSPGAYAGYRYLVVLYPFLFLSLGLACRDVLGATRLRAVQGAVFFLLLAGVGGGSIAYYVRAARDHPVSLAALHSRGDDLFTIVDRLGRQSPNDSPFLAGLQPFEQAVVMELMGEYAPQEWDDLLPFGRRLEPKYLGPFYRGLGARLTREMLLVKPTADLGALAASVRSQFSDRPALSRFVLEGVGKALSESRPGRPLADRLRESGGFASLSGDLAESIKIGFGMGLTPNAYVFSPYDFRDVSDPAILTGVGVLLHRTIWFRFTRNDYAAEMIQALDKPLRRDVMRGFVREASGL